MRSAGSVRFSGRTGQAREMQITPSAGFVRFSWTERPTMSSAGLGRFAWHAKQIMPSAGFVRVAWDDRPSMSSAGFVRFAWLEASYA